MAFLGASIAAEGRLGDSLGGQPILAQTVFISEQMMSTAIVPFIGLFTLGIGMATLEAGALPTWTAWLGFLGATLSVVLLVQTLWPGPVLDGIGIVHALVVLGFFCDRRHLHAAAAASTNDVWSSYDRGERLKMRFEVEVLIERPVEDVYAFYTDVAKWPLWNKLIREPSAAETPWRLGTQIQAIVFGRPYTSKIIAVETNRKVTSKRRPDHFPPILS